MANFEIKKATRQGIIPLIGLYSESGCGKTMSALLLARGLAGPTGKIVMVDTESRRGSLYADVIPGGYEVLDLDQPFSPKRYIEAVEVAEKAGAAVVVTDSMSHEWEGIGGVCDMAGDNESRTGRTGLHNWKDPKMEHAKMVQRLLRSAVPLVCCIRAKYKTRQQKGTKEMADNGVINPSQIGKTVIIKDHVTSPIQAEDFIFEMTCHAEILQDHTIIVTKCSHPALRDCLPKDRERPIKIEDGQALAKWCASAGVSSPTSEPDTKSLVKKLWVLLKDVRGHENNWLGAEAWLIGNKIIADGQSVLKLTAAELQDVINKTEIVFQEQKQQP